MAELAIVARPRQGGKTTEVVEWIQQGARTDSYPGWSRVLLTHTVHDADRVRRDFGLDYHQVFSIEEWRTARLGRLPVEVAMDNADIVLANLIGQWPVMLTMTGELQ